MDMIASKRLSKFIVHYHQVERGFSTMIRIKTRPRIKLLTENLDNLMTISLIGAKIKSFKPDLYIEYRMKTNNIRNLPNKIDK